jgi:uncharacterized glyoxalase superfamily protein PhnB
MAHTTASVWPCINYRDAHAAIDFLKVAFGFEATLVVPGDESRPVPHAELRLPSGGGVMLGSQVAGDDPFASLPTGVASIYVVVDDPDARFERATAAGCEVVRPIESEATYEQRGFTVRDLDGNLWSFGTYAGA